MPPLCDTLASPAGRTKEELQMLGIVVLIIYAALMFGATVIFTKRTHDAESFHVADRRIGTGVAAMSITSTRAWL